MTYDQWKCTDPREFEPEPEECPHEGSHVDWQGQAHCDRCGATWWASQEETAAYQNLVREHDVWCRRMEFRDRWFGWWDRLRWPWPRRKPLLDDDLPF